MQALLDHYTQLSRDGIGLEYDKVRHAVEKDPSYLKRITPNTPQVVARNRYRNIVTLEDTRVKLQSGESDYINANFIKVLDAPLTIAAQGPLESTTGHFWQMCWEQDVPLILMLTDFREPVRGFEGENREKCHKYFPDAQTSVVNTNDFRVTCTAPPESLHKGWWLRKIAITHMQSKVSKNLVHLHCQEWPDFGRLDESQLEGLKWGLDIVANERAVGRGPLVVHCSAGIGRTGTFLAIETLLWLAKQEQWEEVNVPKVVTSLRNQRPGMVQSVSQYGMIYDVLVSLLNQ